MFNSNHAAKLLGLPATIVAAGFFSVTLGTGCAGPGAQRVATGGPETITQIDRIDDQDWSLAATTLTNSMLSQDNLFTPPPGGGKRILYISRIINTTGQMVDTDLLVKQIRITLNKSGKVITQTTDAHNQQDANVQNFEADKTAVVPDYRLSGKLIETRAEAGNIRQSTFYFQLSLTDKNGNDIWEDQKPITKIGSHNSVGL